MQLIIEIPDEKASFFMELVENLNFIKVASPPVEDEYIAPTKDELKAEIRQAVKEVNLIKQGKLKGRPVEDLLNEL